ncbi:putative histone H1/H5 family protein, HCT subfamily [Reticulomyxa filosa]|uniref:Putative histone H1/H5 family protein, HCT subfamily n=1 Tax=Reticulomyxa filosa TaxID=46433 RepID=X6N7X7_RETFI|nr:putative histone H1/H5 family protein, HCT subfamily [Reticulomyxa filosa]|eukprot:ETO22023.1 putative histone H1/H5 family protein, HCT subfamily [Reticulomyxa filosa]
MNKDNKFFDDISKIASSAFATAANIKREISSYVKDHVEALVKKMNFVTKDEFDVLRKITSKAKQDLIEIKKVLGIEILPDEYNSSKKSSTEEKMKKKAPAKKSAAKKAPAKKSAAKKAPAKKSAAKKSKKYDYPLGGKFQVLLFGVKPQIINDIIAHYAKSLMDSHSKDTLIITPIAGKIWIIFQSIFQGLLLYAQCQI